MSSQEDQYLPNDQTVQIDFKPNPLVLDNRGRWAADLVESLGMPDWQISDRQIVALEKDKAQVIITFRSCTATHFDLTGREVFPNWATKFLRTVFSLRDFGDPITVNRIGVLSRFYTKFLQGFEQLAKQFRDRYVEIRPDGLKTINSTSCEAELTDLGAPLNFRDVRGEFYTWCGPMKREQAKRDFFQYKDGNTLPDAGLFFMIDYFVTPKEEMTSDEVITKVTDFAFESWDRHQRIRKLIVGVEPKP